jgi:hypothetical protein
VKSVLVLPCLFILFSPPAAAAAENLALAYAVLKDGEPIGHEAVHLARDGETAIVEVETDTRVKVLFLDFHYHHRRTETWMAGKLERMVADTDDDGSIHHIEAQSTGSNLAVVADGGAKEFPPDALPLTLWGKAVLDRTTLYSIVDAEPFHVTVTAMGRDFVRLKGRDVAASHYRMTGDVERELWYGEDGFLLKTTFERRGYPIEFVRQ